jgi:hypothetical protein
MMIIYACMVLLEDSCTVLHGVVRRFLHCVAFTCTVCCKARRVGNLERQRMIYQRYG